MLPCQEKRWPPPGVGQAVLAGDRGGGGRSGWHRGSSADRQSWAQYYRGHTCRTCSTQMGSRTPLIINEKHNVTSRCHLCSKKGASEEERGLVMGNAESDAKAVGLGEAGGGTRYPLREANRRAGKKL